MNLLTDKEYAALKHACMVAGYIVVSGGVVALVDWLGSLGLDNNGALAVAVVGGVNVILAAVKKLLDERTAALEG